MTRFQIRTPENKRLENIFCEMAEHAKRQTKDLMDQDITESQFFHQVRESVAPYVKKFEMCNLQAECSHAVAGGTCLDPNNRIYMLLLPMGLNALYDDLAFEAMESFKHQYRPDVSREIFGKLGAAFRQALGKYVYFNPVCGVHPMCEVSHEISPWSEEVKHVS